MFKLTGVALSCVCLGLALVGCRGSSGHTTTVVRRTDKVPQPYDLGGCELDAYLRDGSTGTQVEALRRLLEADRDVVAFKFLSRQELLKETSPHLAGQSTKSLRSHFLVIPSRADVVPTLRASLRAQPRLVRVTASGCPLLAHEGGSATYTQQEVVKAFAAHRFDLAPFKPPAGSSQPIIPTGPQVLLGPRHHEPFFVFVAASPQEAHKYYAEFTRVIGVGTVDLRQGNIFVSSDRGLTATTVRPIEAALTSLSRR